MPVRRRRLRAAVVAGGVIVAVALVVGGVAYAKGDNGPAYRTATVARGSLDAGLDLVGTIVPVQSASVGFAQAGTVASVSVSPGSKVTAGQTVAQLDLTSLQAKLTQAQAVEAAARQTLAAAENGQLPASSGSGQRSSSAGSSSAGSSSGGSSSGGSRQSTAAISSAQQKVVDAQKAADAAAATARVDLQAATAGCGPHSSRSTAPDTRACLAAEGALLAAQEDLAAKQSAVTAAQAMLTKALSSSTAAASGSTSPAPPTVSAAQLTAFQAAVDADDAATAVAQQNLAQGTAVAPVSGTVVAVGLSVGQTVAASSSTAVITVATGGGYQATANVPVASIGKVTVGQAAFLVADGRPGTLAGTVVAIAATPSASGFLVTLGLPGATSGLRQGQSASVRLSTGRASDVLVVPTSAVHTFGTRHVVEVVNGRTMQPAVITIGLQDPLRTQVLSGLKQGQRVVLADLSSTVTSDSSTSGTGGGLGRRGLGGAGVASGFGGARLRRAGG